MLASRLTSIASSPARSNAAGARARTTVVAQVAKGKQVVGPWVFFDRQRESEFMSDILTSEPVCLHLLVGPQNCGKTALLRHLKETLSPQPFLVVKALRSSGAFEEQRGNPEVFAVELQGAQEPATMPLGKLTRLLNGWIANAAAASAAPPVIVIDEANRLSDWKEDSTAQGLLDKLVSLSKESRCHVILGTSDAFMVYWLQQRGLRDGQFEVLTLGNLGEEDAKKFVCDTLRREYGRSPDFQLPDSIWPELHAVCGGNFGALKIAMMRAAAAFKGGYGLEAAWALALEQRLTEAMDIVDRASTPNCIPALGGLKPAWTPQQWSAALKELSSHPGHAVPVRRMRAVLGGEDSLAGAAALESLVRFNFLSVREPSPIAYDLPKEVYGVYPTRVVVAPNAAILHYIRQGGGWKEDT